MDAEEERVRTDCLILILQGCWNETTINDGNRLWRDRKVYYKQVGYACAEIQWKGRGSNSAKRRCANEVKIMKKGAPKVKKRKDLLHLYVKLKIKKTTL